jgi:hypothetical protein
MKTGTWFLTGVLMGVGTMLIGCSTQQAIGAMFILAAVSTEIHYGKI